MERLRQLRIERDLSQAKLAVLAGMDPATYNRLEQGKGNPNLRTLERVADALGVRIIELLEEEAPKTQAPLPLENVGRGIIAVEAQASGRLYTEFEFFGRILVQNWKDDLEEWGTKFPSEEIPNLFDFGRLAQWARDIGHTRSMYQALARNPQVPKREELEDTLRLLEEAERGAFEIVKRVFQPAKEYVEFQRIWETNDLDAVLSNAENR